jgi:hypothetical protein
MVTVATSRLHSSTGQSALWPDFNSYRGKPQICQCDVLILNHDHSVPRNSLSCRCHLIHLVEPKVAKLQSARKTSRITFAPLNRGKTTEDSHRDVDLCWDGMRLCARGDHPCMAGEHLRKNVQSQLAIGILKFLLANITTCKCNGLLTTTGRSGPRDSFSTKIGRPAPAFFPRWLPSRSR